MREDLTQKDVEKIEKEIEYRKLVVRPEAIEAVKTAREQGDLSENFEYYAAKREKNQNESRIRYLERVLKNAHIVADHSGEDEVGLNNTVVVYIEEDDEEETYRIVTPIRASSVKNLIPTDSPMAKALMGHRVGDKVMVQVSDSYSYEVEIRRIINTGDDDDLQIRTF